MAIRDLLLEMLGNRSIDKWNELSEEIAYNNWINNRASLTFSAVYNNILEYAPPGSYLHWVKFHNNEETKRFRRKLKYKYDTFKSVREIVLYLHSKNYLAGKYGSPTPNQVEDMLGKDSIWYVGRNYNEDESEQLRNFFGLEL